MRVMRLNHCSVSDAPASRDEGGYEGGYEGGDEGDAAKHLSQMLGHLGMRVNRTEPFSAWFPFRNVALKGKGTESFPI